MGEPTVIAPRAGEVVGDPADRRVEILADHDALHATWSRFGPGREGADLHVHRRHTDILYVLDGELTVRLGPEGEGVVVPAGTLARVPPLVVHGFRNATDAELRYLNFHIPGLGFAHYLRALRDGRTLAYDQEPPPADGGRPATEAMVGGGERAADGVVVLADIDEIRIAEVQIDPGVTRSVPHAHQRHAQSYYVLDGEMRSRSATTICGRSPGRGCTCRRTSRTPSSPPAPGRCSSSTCDSGWRPRRTSGSIRVVPTSPRDPPGGPP